MINAHIIDSRGVYLRTEEVDPSGPQPAGAIYESLPALQDGKTRMWLDDGWKQVPDSEVPALPDPPAEPVPQSCTRRQGQRALLEIGRLGDVEAAIESISDPYQKRVAQVEYEAGTWERGSQFLIAMWSQLGGTEEELDELFRSAVTF